MNAKDQPVLRYLISLKAGRVEVKCRKKLMWQSLIQRNKQENFQGAHLPQYAAQ